MIFFPNSDNQFSCLCPSSFSTAHSCHLRNMIYFVHRHLDIPLFSFKQPVPLTFAPLLTLEIIVFLLLLINIQEVISVSSQARAGGNVVPQGPEKWNLNLSVAGVLCILNSATGTPLADT
uniref:Uncharacterized protein n=1 Tax=Micrurus spixii TaxID=129469 RepID=A0A2D4MT85_9SAUR